MINSIGNNLSDKTKDYAGFVGCEMRVEWHSNGKGG